jgi:hypothetical protein
MAKSIANITGDFMIFVQQVNKYLNAQGKTGYDRETFKWFRPPDVTDTSDLQQIHKPYTMEELDELAEKLSEATSSGNEGDYALVMTQTDLITAANRAFAERHASKLQQFACAVGTAERLNSGSDFFQENLMDALQEIKRRASSDIA